MPTEGVLGAKVLINLDNNVVIGQRGAKYDNQMDMVDMTTKADFPYKKSRPGWEGPAKIDCDALLVINGEGGFAAIANMAKERVLRTVVITLDDSGEQGEGQAWLLPPTFDAPQDKEGTMAFTLQFEDEITWTQGS